MTSPPGRAAGAGGCGPAARGTGRAARRRRRSVRGFRETQRQPSARRGVPRPRTSRAGRRSSSGRTVGLAARTKLGRHQRDDRDRRERPGRDDESVEHVPDRRDPLERARGEVELPAGDGDDREPAHRDPELGREARPPAELDGDRTGDDGTEAEPEQPERERDVQEGLPEPWCEKRREHGERLRVSHTADAAPSRTSQTTRRPTSATESMPVAMTNANAVASELPTTSSRIACRERSARRRLLRRDSDGVVRSSARGRRDHAPTRRPGSRSQAGRRLPAALACSCTKRSSRISESCRPRSCSRTMYTQSLECQRPHGSGTSMRPTVGERRVRLLLEWNTLPFVRTTSE